MKTAKELKDFIQNKKSPMNKNELLDLMAFFKTISFEEFDKFMQEIGTQYDDVIKPNMTLSIKKKMFEGREKEFSSFIKVLLKNKHIKEKDIETIKQRFFA